MLGAQKYQQGRALFRRDRRSHAAGSRPRRHARLQYGGEDASRPPPEFSRPASAHRCSPIRRAFSRAYEQTRAEFSITDSGREFLGLGQGEFAGHSQDRSRSACRKRQPQSRRLAQTARTRAGPLHRDSRTLRRARSGRLSLLRFRRHRRARQALLLQRPHGQENPRRQHHALGRRLPSAANRRRPSTAKACRGRKCCWSIAACRKILSTRAPPRRK